MKHLLFVGLVLLIIICMLFFLIIIVCVRKINEKNKIILNNNIKMHFLDKWLEKFSLDLFEEHFGYSANTQIVIVGMDDVGQILYNMLKQQDMNIMYFIDDNADSIYYGIDDLEVISIEQLDEMILPELFIVADTTIQNRLTKYLEARNYQGEVITIENIIYNH